VPIAPVPSPVPSLQAQVRYASRFFRCQPFGDVLFCFRFDVVRDFVINFLIEFLADAGASAARMAVS
jgi:hypothetical protein